MMIVLSIYATCRQYIKKRANLCSVNKASCQYNDRRGQQIKVNKSENNA